MRCSVRLPNWFLCLHMLTEELALVSIPSTGVATLSFMMALLFKATKRIFIHLGIESLNKNSIVYTRPHTHTHPLSWK